MIELARTRVLEKPWGVRHTTPWLPEQGADSSEITVGEICFERAQDQPSRLLLKVLLTSAPLSIQVHPDDAFAAAIGLPRGKTEAWYVLDADPDAVVGVGWTRRVTKDEVRQAAEDGSIAELLAWRAVKSGDVIFVPAGTVHAIGAGVVIAEIQQRSDATFRLHDYGSSRELHVARALAAADFGPGGVQPDPRPLSHERTLLVANGHFVFERLDLDPGSTWKLQADRETWLLVIDGSAEAGALRLATGKALFVEADSAELSVGRSGAVCLVGYTGAGGPMPRLLEPAHQAGSQRPPIVPASGQVPVNPPTHRTGIPS